MGLFSWFAKAAGPPPLTERVWRDDAARWGGVIRSVREADGATLLVVFFEATAEVARAQLTTAALPFFEVGDTPRPWERGAQVGLVRADRLRFLAGDLPAPLQVIGAELHPLPAEGRALVGALASRTAAVPTFHTALDEPLLVLFGGGRIAEVMDQLGLPRDEPVEHTLVTRSLANAREKLAKSVRNPREATSMAAWFERNT